MMKSTSPAFTLSPSVTRTSATTPGKRVATATSRLAGSTAPSAPIIAGEVVGGMEDDAAVDGPSNRAVGGMLRGATVALGALDLMIDDTAATRATPASAGKPNMSRRERRAINASLRRGDSPSGPPCHRP